MFGYQMISVNVINRLEAFVTDLRFVFQPLALAKNCHFRTWLSEADPMNLNASVIKKVDREDLLLLLSFCLGFQPQDEPCESLGLGLDSVTYRKLFDASFSSMGHGLLN